MKKSEFTIIFALLVAVLSAWNVIIANETDNSFLENECQSESIITDSMITAKIKALLMKEPELSALKIHVTTKGGMVTLSGEVYSEYEKNLAISLAANVNDVEIVYSNLSIHFS